MYGYLKLDFRTRVFGKPFGVLASCNRATGFILTAYWRHKPVFNLVSDRCAEFPSPIRHEHEWGVVRWGTSR